MFADQLTDYAGVLIGLVPLLIGLIVAGYHLFSRLADMGEDVKEALHLIRYHCGPNDGSPQLFRRVIAIEQHRWWKPRRPINYPQEPPHA